MTQFPINSANKEFSSGSGTALTSQNFSENLTAEDVTVKSKTVSRRVSDLLPNVFQTDTNKKFLNATLDQLTSPGELKELQGFIGRKKAPTFKPKDHYLTELTDIRQNYQFEPGTAIKDKSGKFIFSSTYQDLINQIKFHGGTVDNHDRLFESEVYNYNVPIDFDKFINYSFYYWLPSGPESVTINTNLVGSTVTHNVKNNAQTSFIIDGKDSLTMTFIRGNTYKFDVNTSEIPFLIKTERSLGKTNNLWTQGITNNGTANSILTFTIPKNAPDLLFYQSPFDLEMGGTIHIENEDTVLDVDRDIEGAKFFTSSNGVIFTNGLKVTFDDNALPITRREKEFYLEGVGDVIRLINVTDLETPEPYIKTLSEGWDETLWDEDGFEQTLNSPLTKDYHVIQRGSLDINPWSRINRWFHISVIRQTAIYNNNILELDQNFRAERPIIEFNSDIELFNFGRVAKASVDLIDDNEIDVFSNLENKDGAFVDGISLQDNMRVIFLADQDPDVRDQIFKVTFIDVDGDGTKKLHFTKEPDGVFQQFESVLIRQGLKNQGKTYVSQGLISGLKLGQIKTKVNQLPLYNIFDSAGISFSDENIYPSTTFKGTTLFEYKVGTGSVNDAVLPFPLSFKHFGNIGDIVFNNTIIQDSFTFITNGVTQTKLLTLGKFNKIKSVTDVQQTSIWNIAKEKSKQYVSTIILVDKELQQFEVRPTPDTDVFEPNLIVHVNNKLIDENTNFTRTIIDGVTFITFTDKKKLSAGDLLSIQSYSKKRDPKATGFYNIPRNLESNGINGDVLSLTLGELRNQVVTIGDSSLDFVGVIPGDSNLRDIGLVKNLGKNIVQNSAGLHKANFLLTDQKANLINSIKFSQKEYTKFKNKFIRAAETLEFDYVDKVAFVDEILLSLGEGKTEDFAFFYSDMVPYGKNFKSTKHIVFDPSDTTYDLDSVFDPNVPSNRAILIYLNGVLLMKDFDYTLSATDLAVTILAPLAVDDVIDIKDFSSTDSNFVPETPTKLGLYPLFKPEKFIDTSYAINKSVEVIRGHDGSLIPSYGDFKDDLIMELETRIYNNIKTKYNENIFDILNVIPGKFRDTGYTNKEINEILSISFLTWAGNASINHTVNKDFQGNNELTWTWSKFKDQIDNEQLLGYYRGIYRYMFDTDRPHSAPWEMLGFSIEPTWWETEYGAAPYTKGNTVLWDDLADGIIRQGARAGRHKIFERPGLRDFIPVDTIGNLISPLGANIVGSLQTTQTSGPFIFGDGGPVENAWRRSSEFPFAIQLLLALTKPAQYFDLLFDTNLVVRENGQIVNKTTKTHIKNSDYIVHTEDLTKRVSGYNAWVSEYLIYNGVDVKKEFGNKIKDLNTNMMYKLAGFSNKKLMNVLAEQISPSSIKNSIFIPNEDFEFSSNNISAVRAVDYSGVIIEKIPTGYKLFGYDIEKPFFTILPSKITTNKLSINVGGEKDETQTWLPRTAYQIGDIITNEGKFFAVSKDHTSGDVFVFSTDILEQLSESPFRGGITVTEYKDFSKTSVNVPYGTEYINEQQVFDFLISYGRYLTHSGFIFDNFNLELNNIENWRLSGKEFLFWSIQGWQDQNTITLSPAANQLKFESNDGTISSIINKFLPQTVLDFQGLPITTKNLSVSRIGNQFTVKTHPNSSGLYFVKLNIISNEHLLVFNNTTIFDDVIYEPVTGQRQFRLKIEGNKTSNWQGQLELPGYIFNESLVSDWEPFRDYDLGELAKFQSKIYVAITTHSGVAEFNFNNFCIAHQLIEGIIPNWDTKAEQFKSFYDISNNDINRDQNILAKQLIGFQTRDYFENLRISDVSQIQFYQNFIKTKGTKTAVNALIRAKFDNLNSDITFFEEWAFREGIYGSSDNNKVIEISLDEAKFNENPVAIILPDPALDIIQLSELDGIPISKDELHFKEADFNFNLFKNVDSNTNKKTWIDIAGHPRLDDVDTTLLKLSDITALNSKIKDVGNAYTIWTAFDDTVQDWNVYRVTSVNAVIISSEVVSGSTNLYRINTDQNHNFNKGDHVVIKNFDSVVDGFYKINNVITLKQFEIVLTTTTSAITASGLLFKLQSIRYAKKVNLNDFFPAEGWQKDEIVWIDTNSSNKWEVLQKKFPYDIGIVDVEQPIPLAGSEFGFSIVGEADNNRLIVGSPGDVNGKVEIFIRTASGLKSVKNLSPLFLSSNNDDRFGASLDIIGDANSPLTYTVFAGAPSSSDTTAGQGKAYILDSSIGGDYAITTTFTSPSPTINGNFGHAGVLATNWLFISEPGANKVHAYQKGTISPTTEFTFISTFSAAGLSATDKFGQTLRTNLAGTEIFVGAPFHNNNGIINTGAVFKFTRSGTTFTEAETIISTNLSNEDRFGSAMDFDDVNNRLVVSATHDDTNLLTDSGTVYLFTRQSNGTYLETQIINDPNAKNNVLFGDKVKFDDTGNLLAISTILGNTNIRITFDNGDLIVDGGQTTFTDILKDSGQVTVFELIEDFTFHSQLIGSKTLNELDNFGQDLWLSDNKLYAGANKSDHEVIETFTGDGTTKSFLLSGQFATADIRVNLDNTPILLFTSDNVSPNSTITFTENAPITGAVINVTKLLRDNGIVFEYTNTNRESGWLSLRNEGDLVDINRIKKIYTYNDRIDTIIDFLDFVDSRKGKIPGIADQEIAWKTGFDPAIYTVGDEDKFNINAENHWGDSQVGMLWWDMEFVKNIEYEQGDITYRKNNWNKFFPGTSIDIYEWVKSENLPSTYTGTGTPKFADDTTYVQSQKFNSSLDLFETVYYFWVKNTLEIPINSSRILNASQVSAYITDPKSQGLHYVAFIEDSSILNYNINDTTENKELKLHVEYQEKVSDIPTHVEWVLIRENDPDSEITSELRKKFFDSLIGFNENGDAVPDLTIAKTLKLGTGNRPRQTMFLNRLSALEELVKQVNSVFKLHQIVNLSDMTRLNSEAPEPTLSSGKFDQTVKTLEERNFIKTAELKVPWNVLVQANEELNGLWQIFQWNGTAWIETLTQSYVVSNFWNFIDWYAPGFSANTIIKHVLNSEIDIVNIVPVVGDIVKILNDGNNKFEVLRFEGPGSPVVDTSLATITLNDGVYSVIGLEDATIQLKDSLYKLTENNFGWDTDVFENTLWDELPVIELRKILEALHLDIFIKDLKIEFNKLWFLMVRFINAEQKFTDWILKTSFLFARQNIRKLSQLPVFQNDNHDFVVDFLKEAKPYKTNIREYVFNYDTLDPFNGDVTDFDLQPFFDDQLKRFRSPDVDTASDDTKIKLFPYKSWFDNYKNGVNSITVINAGAGYTSIPIVTISGGGGAGATGTANLVGDSIKSITVTNKGSGYTTTPTVTITGGGLDPLASTNALAYAQLENDQIRNLKTHLKFDRIKGSNDLTTSTWNALPATKDIANNIYHAADRIEIFYSPTAGMIDDNFADLMFGVDFEGVKVKGLSFEFSPGWDISRWDQLGFDAFEIGPEGIPVLSGPGNIDTIVDGTDYSFDGLAPDTITVEGGDYISPWHSHAPEEAIPGKIFESINIKTFDKARLSEPAIGWSRFTNMRGNTVYRRIALSFITTLATDLNISDTTINVVDASVLPIPNTVEATPGVIFIGGERIEYYTITGNVLGQLTRATQGTGAPDFHKSGADVFDYSLVQQVPGTNLDTKIWYDSDPINSTNGLGLQKQNTVQAIFLKNSPTKLPS